VLASMQISGPPLLNSAGRDVAEYNLERKLRLQCLRLACRSGARLIPILATRHGRARPGHDASLDRYIQSILKVVRHAKKSEVEGEIENQTEY
jgi:hypothetical protein